MTKLQEHKGAIRAFLRTEVWTEEKLCALLAHAEDKLTYWSCCCLIGVATANHALRERAKEGGWMETNSHYFIAKELPFAREAETAFSELGRPQEFPPNGYSPEKSDVLRRLRIRPIIRAELRRRAVEQRLVLVESAL